MSVVTADTIEKANIVDLLDLKAVVPSLDSRQYQSTTNATFFIRGFGNGSNNPGVEPSVAVFVDGVYRSKIQGQISDLPMLERIEVLRGPQSTLFGKNASAGVVNIVTKKPSFEKFTSLKTEFGNYNSRKASVYTTGPMSDALAYSFSANVNTRDGQADNPTTGNPVGDRDRFGFRSELLYVPSDDLSVRITADYDEFDEIFFHSHYSRLLQHNLRKPNAIRIRQAARCTFSWRHTPWHFTCMNVIPIQKYLSDTTLESITSYRTSDNNEVQDVDFDAANVIAPSPISKELSGMTQEIRWYSENNEKVNWLVGGFYYQEDMDFNESIYFGPLWRPYIDAFLPGALAGVAAAFGLPNSSLFAGGQGNTETSAQDNSTMSLFAQVDIQVSEKLNALLGVSYIEDEKEVSYNQINLRFVMDYILLVLEH